MNLYIPSLKDVLLLIKDWEAEIHYETRNIDFIKNAFQLDKAWDMHSQVLEKFKIVAGTPYNKRCINTIKVLIPAGTELVVDRIYIRHNCEAFDSISFRIIKDKVNAKTGMHGRFWVKLANANGLEFVGVEK